MAVKTENGITTLTPTAWKWFLGAAFIFFMIPPFGMLIAIVFVLMGAGVMQRLALSEDGIQIRNWFSEKSYAWHEIDDFRVHKVKSGLFTAANMVSFTHADKDGTIMGKAAKALVGGTHSMPAVGLKPQKLIHLMRAYKTGHVPADTPAVDEAPAWAGAPPRAVDVADAPRANRERQSKPRPRAVPATPRTQRSTSTPKPGFGGKPRASTPLVQDGGGLFGRRRPDSLFRS